MGAPMAANLAKSPPVRTPVALPIRVYNRSRGKADELQTRLGDDRIVVAGSPAEIATTCDVIFTSLSSDEAVKAVLERGSVQETRSQEKQGGRNDMNGPGISSGGGNVHN